MKLRNFLNYFYYQLLGLLNKLSSVYQIFRYHIFRFFISL